MNKNDFILRMHPLIKNGIAHRGYHNENDIENGLRAFKNAIDNNIAFELDVHLTKDGNLVVCHDSNLKRVTGKEGIIEELTLEEIKEYTLSDGEKIPTLREVLDLTNERVPIVLEIKSVKNHKKITNAIKEELSTIKDDQSILIIAFDPRDLIFFKNYRFLTSLLLANVRKDVFSLSWVADSIDIEDKMLELNSIKRYYKRHFINVWTIRDYEQLDKVIGKCDTVTFENIDYKVVKEKLNS